VRAGEGGDVSEELPTGDESQAPKAPPELFPAESGLEPTGPAEGFPSKPVPTSPTLVTDGVVTPPLLERMAEADAASLSDEQRIGVIVELRSGHPLGVKGAAEQLRDFVSEVAPGTPTWVTASHTYLATSLTANQIRALVQRDAAACEEAGPTSTTRTAPRWCIHRLWPNFETRALIHRTIITTKCDAAHRSFNALGQGIVWAVMDSGIDGRHRHFKQHDNLDLPDGLQHRTFIAESTDADALRDNAGHGTHVAGILAGVQSVADGKPPLLAATWYHDDGGNTQVEQQQLRRISGMAPQCRLLSCKVLRDDLTGDVAALLAALEYIQELNNDGRDLRVHGVNLSVGYPFDPSWFAAGLTPVCREVDRLVRSGVVVVIAAGNSGYGFALDKDGRKMRLGFDLTINDPGNAEQGITVGATSWRPHATGISYFSSKGPTGDGRLKPDLVAPGERVVSAGAGKLLKDARVGVPKATYVENSGTSMAAPHVSGVAAAFLSVHREFIGRPDDVKRILLSSATDLGRARAFQGTGLVDAMRAIQSV
jgi:serine protease AprX